MITNVLAAKYVGNYKIWLRFNDGSEGEVDLGNELYGEVFEPLKDLAYFQRFQLNSELRTVCWPNGADFAPEFLRSSLQVAA